MGLLGKIIGLKDDESGLSFLLSGRGKSPSEDYPESSKEEVPKIEPSVGSDYYNCTECGGMGRTGGNHSYDTIGGTCTNCSGTGHVD
jgi:hypothetical protein